jgi:hypothetical protein
VCEKSPETQQPPPHHFAGLQGDIKTLVTVNSALLGLTVTFASDLLDSGEGRALIGTSWIMFSLALLLAIVASGALYSKLRNKENLPRPEADKGGTAVALVNASFYALLIAIVLLSIGGWQEWNGAEEHSAVERAIADSFDVLNSQSGDRNALQLVWLERTDTLQYEMRFRDNRNGEYHIVYDLDLEDVALFSYVQGELE